MKNKSLVKTKKLTDTLLNDLNTQIDKKENELLELKIKCFMFITSTSNYKDIGQNVKRYYY